MEILLRTLLLGAVSGSVYALAAVGIVLTYKTSGVLNFGYGALAVFTTFIYWQLTQWGVHGLLAAMLVLLVVAPMLGFFLDAALFRPLQGQPPIIGVIATVGLSVLLQGISIFIWSASARAFVSLPQDPVRVLGVNIGIDQLMILVMAGASAASLGAMLRYTKIGVAFRAVVDNRDVAGIVGVNTGLISGLSWALSTSFAALFGIVLLPKFFLDPVLVPPLIIAYVLAAAVVGYLRSLPYAYVGGLALGIGEALLINYGEGGLATKLKDALPFLFITAAVLLAPKALRLAGQGASFVVKTRELARISTARARGIGAGAFFALLALAPALVAGSIRNSLVVSMGHAILFLSMVILTGYSGQISLGHTGFMGIATFTTANLVTDMGLPVWLGFLAGVLAAIPAGALIGFIAVRVHGLYLALMTMAFAYMAQSMLFEQTAISGSEGGIAVPRPELFSSDGGFFYLVWLIFGGCVALAVSLRTGRTGRVLAAMRDSETACRALGIGVTRYKVLIFGLSAAMAGVAGILLSMYEETATSRDFIPYLSLVYTTLAVLGGIFHVGGAVASGLFYGLMPALEIELLDRLQLVMFGLGATLALANNPEGMFGEMRRGADAVGRLLRRRRAAQRAHPAVVSGGQR